MILTAIYCFIPCITLKVLHLDGEHHSSSGVKMEGTVKCKEGHLMKGLLSPSVKVRCGSKSGTPVWVLENGRPVPDCLKPCANKTEHPAATRSGH